MVLGGVKTGLELVSDSFRVFRRYPRLIVPLLLTWVVIAALTLWARFFRPPLTPQTALFLAFGLIFAQALMLAVSCSLLLEMVEQVERGGSPSLSQAFTDTINENLLSMLPLVLVWSIVWFVLSVIEAIFEDDDRNEDSNYSAENAARTLAGGPSSLLGLSLNALKKGIRMLVFLVLPAIAWEGKGFRAAVSRGYTVFRDNVSAIATGFSLTYLIAAVLFLPVGIILEASSEGLITLSVTQWYLVIAYIGGAWSFSIYLEQMFVADLFLWHKEFEQAVEAAEREGHEKPSMREVPRPTLLDDVASLEERKLPRGGSGPLREEEYQSTDSRRE
jgi:hypothetical protein